jgi:hypothetical protein
VDARFFSLNPVPKAKLLKIDGPPGGIVSLAVHGARPGIRKSRLSPKWGIAVALDGGAVVATYKK